MEDFIQQYREAVAQRVIFLNREVCPKLKVLFGQISLSYESYYQILLNKGTIKPDQYSNDQPITHPVAPSVEPYSDANRTNELSLRLSELNGQYQYLCISFEFTTESLSLKILKAITNILRYIQWEKITVGSDHYMSQSLALALDEIKTTPIYDRLLSDVAHQLTSLTRSALGYIRELSIYHREAYKEQLTHLYFGSIKYNTDIEESKATELFVTALRQSIARSDGFVFYRELANEAVRQLYSNNASELQAQALEKLQNMAPSTVAVVAPPHQQATAAKKNREPLLVAFSELGRCAATLEIIATKLEANNSLYIKYGLTFSQVVVLNIRKFIGISASITYHITCIDDVKGQSSKEELSFNIFMDQLQKRTALLAAYTDRRSVVSQKLAPMTDSELNNLLAHEMYETRMILIRCAGLDDYFKDSTKGTAKGRIRGLKIELSSAKYQLSRVFELRQLYSEEENMKA